MIHAAFAVPGALETPTGGYAYARRLLAEAGAAGLRLDHIALPGGFPRPDQAAVTQALRQLAAVPESRPLLVDGLAFGALPLAGLAVVRAPVAVLLHHPLGLETGLGAAEAARMIAAEAAALTRARAVIVPSRSTAETVAEQLGVPAALIFVAPPGLEPAPPQDAARETAHILCVASLTPRKGQDVLIAALAQLGDRPWRATLAGVEDRDPDYAARLRAMIAEAGLDRRITLTGALAPRALAEAYARAAIFCLPSHHEGYGMVFAEAMAHGLPVLAADIAAAREVMPADACRLVPAGDAAALGAALAALLDDPARAAAMGKAGRRHAATLQGWDATATAVAAVLGDLVP